MVGLMRAYRLRRSHPYGPAKMLRPGFLDKTEPGSEAQPGKVAREKMERARRKRGLCVKCGRPFKFLVNRLRDPEPPHKILVVAIAHCSCGYREFPALGTRLHKLAKEAARA